MSLCQHRPPYPPAREAACPHRHVDNADAVIAIAAASTGHASQRMTGRAR